MKEYRVALLMLTLAFVGCAGGTSSIPQRDTAKYPFRVANIFVGSTSDDQVRRVHGEGLYTKFEGHGGGRYYTNREKTITLNAEIGVDRVIETASIERGLRAPNDSEASGDVPISENLNDDVSIQGGIRLGVGKKEVVVQYGPPDEIRKDGTLEMYIYRSDYYENIYMTYYEAFFVFEGNDLIKVVIHNGC